MGRGSGPQNFFFNTHLRLYIYICVHTHIHTNTHTHIYVVVWFFFKKVASYYTYKSIFCFFPLEIFCGYLSVAPFFLMAAWYSIEYYSSLSQSSLDGHSGHFCCCKACGSAYLCPAPVYSEAKISRFLDRRLLNQSVTSGPLDN